MAAMATTCSPSSPQLRLALNGGNYRKSPAVLVRARLGKQDRWIRALCLAREGARNASGRRCHRISLVRADSRVDGFSGWSGSEGGEESVEPERKKWFGGNDSLELFAVLISLGSFWLLRKSYCILFYFFFFYFLCFSSNHTLV